MASSTIKQGAHWGNRTSVAVPFTAPADGFVQIYSNPNDSSGGYDLFTINDAIDLGIRNYLPSGASVANNAAMKKGEVLKLARESNIRSRSIYFIPLGGG